MAAAAEEDAALDVLEVDAYRSRAAAPCEAQSDHSDSKHRPVLHDTCFVHYRPSRGSAKTNSESSAFSEITRHLSFV